MWTMWGLGFLGRGTQRHEEHCSKERETSSQEEETLRIEDLRTSPLQCRSDQELQGKDSTSEGDHSTTIKSNTKKRAAVYTDANHFVRGSKKPRMETTKGEEAPSVRNPRGVEVVQKAYKDDEEADQVYSSIVGAGKPTFPSDEQSRTGRTDGDSLLRENLMVDSSSKSSAQASSQLPVTLLSSSVETGAFQAENERLKQGFDQSLFQLCRKGDAAADGRIQELEQELHILEEELKNEDEKLYADAVHKMPREVTARANGTYRA
jgi:hypothetical protein